MCKVFCLHIYWHTYIPEACGVQKKASNLLGLELQRCHVGARNQTQVFWENKQYS